MFIAFREEFSGGWNLWLGDEEVTSLTPELKQELPAMTFDEKAEMFFSLVWSNKTRDSSARDITQILDGVDVFVERVTGLSLYDNKLAQGSTSRIQTVTKVDDPEPEIESSTLKAPGCGSIITDYSPSKFGDLDCESKNAVFTSSAHKSQTIVEKHADAGSISSIQQK
ncbi:hypothetical protein PPTG_09708 [Phytophthora nicotianae INRA-310]|uniref:Uncharacterized protein n=2 Tax=Phytophthora nicotianae TaxID=4792 RepID=W2QIG8_PHYN3|nr:hypothetical protein PPTG_09708 [Phytophthora nicotianae INRA-310]ETN12060.1 hypothetical protein PPTG_09708 [Phytophthora nicotianae INRA-310]